MIEIRQLEYLLVLADTQSIHKAADVLYISQPTLSIALKN